MTMAPVITREKWDRAYSQLRTAMADAEFGKIPDLKTLDDVRVRFLGRKGELTELLKQLKDLSLEDRRALGPQAQSAKENLEFQLEKRRRELESSADESASGESLDVTMPGFGPPRGGLH